MDRLRNICSLIISLKEDVTNLELQKYLYFIQAASLILLNREAFTDEIEAWQYGPVVPRAYREFKYEREILVATDIQLEEDIRELVVKIVDEFHEDSASQLVERTHSYPSWIEAWNNKNPIITIQSIRACHNRISEENNGLIF